MAIEASVHFLTDHNPPAGLVDSRVRIDGLNPTWQLYQVFQGRGYDLRSEPSYRYPGSDLPQVEDIYCDDKVQRAGLTLRTSLIQRLPDFQFLDFSYWNSAGNNVNIPVAENVVLGRPMEWDIQEWIPGAQDITFTDTDKKQVLALLYVRTEERSESLARFDRRLDEEREIVLPTGGVVRRLTEAEIQELNGKFPDIPPVPDYEAELAELRRKRQELGVEPISVDRVKEIVSSLADRVEGLLAPTT